MDPDEELEAAFVADADLDEAFEPGTAEVPENYAPTGAVVTELPETTIVGNPRGGGEVRMSDAPATEYREVAKQWQTDPTAATPPEEQRDDPLWRALRRVRNAAAGGAVAGPVGAAVGASLDTDGSVPTLGGRELPSVASIERFAETPDLDVLMPADHSEMIVGTDRRPLAGVTGATDVASFGWADELAGLAGGDHRAEQERARTAGAQEQAPGMYAAGQMAGAAPLALIPGGAATAGGRMAIAGGVGAGAGTLRGAGEAEGDLTQRLEAGALEGALEGAVSAGTAGVAEGAAPLLSRLAESRFAGWADDAADQVNNARAINRLQAAGVRNPSPAPTTVAGRHMARLGGPERIADMLDQERIGGRLLPTQNVSDDLDRLRRETGESFGRVLGRMDAAGGGVSRTELADRGSGGLLAQLADLDSGPAQRAVERGRREIIDPLIQRAAPGPLGRGEDMLSWQRAHELRQHYDDMSGALRRATDPADTSLAGVAQDVRGELSGLMEEAAESVDPYILHDWRDANRRYSLLSYLSDNITPGPSRVEGAFGAAGAIGQGEPLTAVGARVLGDVTSRLGPGLRARGYGAVRRGLSAIGRNGLRQAAASPQLERAARILAGAEQRGGSAPAAAHALLMRSDPEYRAAVEAAENEAPEQAQETDR